MENFTFQNATKIIFGSETELKVGDEIKGQGSKVLLHYGGGSIKKTGLYDKVTNSLKKAGIEFVELAGAMPNPRLGLVNEGIKVWSSNGVPAFATSPLPASRTVREVFPHTAHLMTSSYSL